MRVALAVTKATQDKGKNLEEMLEQIRKAARHKASLVLFGEAAPTGLINNDDPVHDVVIAEPIPGLAIDALARSARDARIYVASGILEKAGNCLFDAVVLINRRGRVVSKYRRISPGWHGCNADSSVYRRGESIPRVETPLGAFAFLICGDLLDETSVNQVRSLNVDWLLVPFARCFDDGSYDQRRWDQDENGEYARYAGKARAVCLMVNYLSEKELAGGSFGASMVVGRDGSILAEMPLGKQGLLLVDA